MSSQLWDYFDAAIARAGADLGHADTSVAVCPSCRNDARRAATRVRVAGKFFVRDQEKIYLRGVTYGPFKPEDDGCLYHTPERVDRDFEQMAAAGINCVRVYSTPPRWLLDCAARHGLLVMVGVAWSQYVAFFEHRELLDDCFDQVDRAVATCGGHPALLAFAVGNEIPATIVRWYGHRRIERHIERLCKRIKAADPQALVTYANYPTTEYLDLPFLDFVSFNVYFNSTDRFAPYLARLQNIADQRPLVVSEVGFEANFHGEEKLPQLTRETVQTCFAAGCAGLFYFSWTDEWFRHGQQIEDWKFGLTYHDRSPRKTLDALARTYRAAPFEQQPVLPKISVVVCSRNGSRTIGETIEQALKLAYPDFEVIVVDDGSTDATAQIASQFPVRLIRQKNQGLSVARNVGLAASEGKIVAYLDDDAYPDEHWLHYLVHALLSSQHVGVGGPNLVPHEDGLIAQCVARAPGGPTHVLLTDSEAEHIPGCNMAFFREALQEAGGFDPQFRIAGDDVDICWRLQQDKGSLGFAPAALVWHHRRSSIKAFWRQQMLYGKAEALLERKWPEKYNAVGHATWSGRLYGAGAIQFLFGNRRQIYHGVWGEALFQQVYHVPPSPFWTLPMMPEWYVFTAFLAIVSLLGILWPWLLLAMPLLAAAIFYEITAAAAYAAKCRLDHVPSFPQRLRMRVLIAVFYRMQPLARLVGRYSFGLTPWRLRGVTGFRWPIKRLVDVARRNWRMPAEWLARTESTLRDAGGAVRRGSDFDDWDLDLEGGLIAGARVRLMTEDLQYGSQLLRFRVTPRVSRFGKGAVAAGTILCGLAVSQEDPMFMAVAILLLCMTLGLIIREAGAAIATVLDAVGGAEEAA